MTPDLKKQIEQEAKEYAEDKYLDLDRKKYLHKQTLLY